MLVMPRRLQPRLQTDASDNRRKYIGFRYNCRNFAAARRFPGARCPMDVSRRTVVVTGAGAGAGRAIAQRFGRAGWRVALVSRGRSRLEDAAREIERTGGEALVAPADVSDC